MVRGALRKGKIAPALADTLLRIIDDGVKAVDSLRAP